MEIWKDITGYDGFYMVSSFGRVKSLDRVTGDKRPRLVKGKILIGGTTPTGYKFISLYNGSKKRRDEYVHRLVAISFIVNLENKPQVNHIDGNKSNNNVDNLEWATIKENQVHSWEKLNRKPAGNFNGSLNPNSKLSINDVIFIKEMYLSKRMTSIELAQKFLINRNYVYQICKNKVWKIELEKGLI